MMKHHSQVVDFTNLDFKAIDTKILADETKEKEDETVAEAINVVEGDGTIVGDTTAGGVMDEAHMDMGHVKEVVSAP
nr:hypothetical protein CFP56_32069 [Quercus suber]